MTTPFAKKIGPPLWNIFGVFFRLDSYRNLAYLALAFPLGLFYFVFLITGLALGFGLYIVVIGLPLLVAVFLCWRLFIRFERLQSRWLLGQPVVSERVRSWSEEKKFWPWFKSRLSSPVSWKGFLFLLLKFPLGLAAFVIVVVAGAVSAALVSAPILYNRVPFEVFDRTIATAGQAWLLAAIGLMLGLLSLHVSNGVAGVFRWLSARLLSGTEAAAAA